MLTPGVDKRKNRNRMIFPMSSFPLYYHSLYSDGLDRTARFPVDRYRLLAERLGMLDQSGQIMIKVPRLATREEVLLVHKKSYVERFLAGGLSEKEIRRIGLRPWKKEIIPRTLRLVGGALEALEEVFRGYPLAGNMAGGRITLSSVKDPDTVSSTTWPFAEVALGRPGSIEFSFWTWTFTKVTERLRSSTETNASSPVSSWKEQLPFRKKSSDLDIVLKMEPRTKSICLSFRKYWRKCRRETLI